MNVTADRSITRWALSFCCASISAFLTSGVVFQLIAPVMVHTVVSGWGRLKVTVMAGASEEHGEVCGDQSVSIMALLLRRMRSRRPYNMRKTDMPPAGRRPCNLQR